MISKMIPLYFSIHWCCGYLVPSICEWNANMRFRASRANSTRDMCDCACHPHNLTL